MLATDLKRRVDAIVDEHPEAKIFVYVGNTGVLVQAEPKMQKPIEIMACPTDSPPDVLKGLYDTELERWFDFSTYDEIVDRENEQTTTLRTLMGRAS